MNQKIIVSCLVLTLSACATTTTEVDNNGSEMASETDQKGDSETGKSTDDSDEPSSEAECENGTSRCNGDIIQNCENEKWVDSDDCSAQSKQCEIVDGNASCSESQTGSSDSETETEPLTSDSEDNVDTNEDSESTTETQGVSDTDADTDTDVDGDTDADIDGGSEDTDYTKTCESEPHDIELQPINMLILLDRSASMHLYDFNGVTFEQVIDNALEEVVTDSENHLVYFGLAAFPSEQCVRDEDSVENAAELCYAADEISVPIGPDNGEAIADQLTTLDTCGGTPIAASLRWAKTYLETNLTADLLKNPTYILLATDGAPNCSAATDMSTCTNTNPNAELTLNEQCLDDQESINAAVALYAGENGDGFVATAKDTAEEFTIKVPTFVVGVGDLAAWDAVMNNIANGGGGESTSDGTSSQYFQATDTAAVTSAFKDIVAEATPCTFPITWDEILIKESEKGCELVAVFPVENGVTNEDAELPFSSDCSNPEGWHYQNVTTEEVKELTLTECATVELCSQTCDDLKYGRLESLSFKFGCRPIVI